MCVNSIVTLVPTKHHAGGVVICPVCFPVAMLNTMTKSNLGRKRLIWPIFLGHCPSLTKVRVEIESGTKTETTKEYCLLTRSPVYVPLAFLDSPGSLPRDGTARGGLGPPTSINSQ